MQRLENARILADTTNKYHVINRATVDIRGRRYYEASGFYEYNVGSTRARDRVAKYRGPAGR